jgi:hypothetical protein
MCDTQVLQLAFPFFSMLCGFSLVLQHVFFLQVNTIVAVNCLSPALDLVRSCLRIVGESQGMATH